MILLSIFQIFDVTDGGLHVVPGFVVERQMGGVVVRAVTQGSVGSAVGEGAGFAVGWQSIHLFFFVQQWEFHFYFNCNTTTTQQSEDVSEIELSLIDVTCQYWLPNARSGESSLLID